MLPFTYDPSDKTFVAWCAAWFEAEGWATLVARGHGSMQLKTIIAQKEKPPLEIILAGFPNGVLKKRSKKNLFYLVYISNNAAQFLEYILPYLTYKTERVHVVLGAQELISKTYNRWHPRPQDEWEKMWELKERLHELTGVKMTTRAKLAIYGKNNKIDQWARKHTECKQCGTTEFPHRGYGLCRRCYMRNYKIKTGRSSGLGKAIGSRSGKAKVTEEIVKQIRQEYQPHIRGKGAPTLARKYNISFHAIYDIINCVTWTHVD